MCGICGYIGRHLSEDTGMQMVQTMRHRGPDNQSVRIYADHHCLLGHARLSIIDLSETANQPMEFGQYAIVFNGEVYNYREIRAELSRLGHVFLRQSDTEVVLHAYQEWGIHCLDRFIGMFAFAILDKQENKLFLARDRAGVKPLYYYQHDQTFMFASETKAFYPHPDYTRVIAKESVALYFKYGYVPAPHSIFQDTHQLLPGHWMVYDISTHQLKTGKYWDVLSLYQQPLLDIGYDEAKTELEKILQSAFEYRMVADVPVGVFLSGGYDSALLTALLQKDRTEKLRTFTIGFEDEKWNEAPAAKALADYLHTDHTEYVCTQEDCKRIIPEIPHFYDEPFADNSAVPTILVSRLARKDVKVALSADGGDETFCGYNRYTGLYGVLKVLRMMDAVRSPLLSKTVGALSRLAPAYSFYHEKGEYLARLLDTPQNQRIALTAEGGAFSTLMQSVYSQICNIPYPDSPFLLDQTLYHDPLSVAMAMDYVNYMPNDILVKVDRAAMSVSLEGRDPLLDHRIVEFAARLPIAYKFKDGQKKRIYKDILYQYVPREMMERPKTGFMMPVDKWLQNDLKYLLEDNLNEKTLSREFFHVENVLKIKDLYYQERLGHENKVIWRLLMFQMWLSNQP